MERLYPLQFRVNLQEKVWGGQRLKPLKGLQADDTPMGESWEVSAVEGKESIVSNGALQGQTLSQLTRNYGPLLTTSPSRFIPTTTWRRRGTARWARRRCGL